MVFVRFSTLFLDLELFLKPGQLETFQVIVKLEKIDFVLELRNKRVLTCLCFNPDLRFPVFRV